MNLTNAFSFKNPICFQRKRDIKLILFYEARNIIKTSISFQIYFKASHRQHHLAMLCTVSDIRVYQAKNASTPLV